MVYTSTPGTIAVTSPSAAHLLKEIMMSGLCLTAGSVCRIPSIFSGSNLRTVHMFSQGIVTAALV